MVAFLRKYDSRGNKIAWIKSVYREVYGFIYIFYVHIIFSF